MNKRNSVSKRVIAFMLVMMMVVGSMPGLFTTGEGRAYAAGGFSGSGQGTEVNPYIVTTPEHLYEIRYELSSYFKLGNDIDLTTYLAVGGGGYNGGAYWSPIGNFDGTLDGDGYVIKGLKIDRVLTNNVGLFGVAGSTATLKNIGLENVDIVGQGHVGGLVGQSEATISNSFVTGKILTDVTNYVSNRIGGLVGYHKNGAITNSYSLVDVSGYMGTGGLVGHQDAGTVSYSYAAGVVDTPHDHYFEGGLIGVQNSNTAPTSSYYDTLTTTQDDDTGKGTPKTTTEMQQQGTFTDWNFDDDWYIPLNQYPILRKFVTQTPIATPDPAGGPVNWKSVVTLTSGTVTASVYYTTNGDDPTTSSTLYVSPVEVNDDVTIKAIAVYKGRMDSAIMSKSYSITRADAPTTGFLAKGTKGGTTSISGVTAAMEYKVNNGEYQEISGTSVDNIAVNVGDTIFVRIIETEITPSSFEQVLTVSLSHINEASAVATLTSTLGTVSTGGTPDETITDIPYGTSLSELMDEITLAAAATVEVFEEDGTTIATQLATGTKIVVTAEDGTTKVTYTVTVVANTVATLTSTLGTVSTGGTPNETIKDIPYGTTLSELMDKITLAMGATVEVYDADGTTTATQLATGTKIVVTAQDGTTKVTYTVTVNASSSGGSGGGGGGPSQSTHITSTDGKLTIPVGHTGQVSLGDAVTIDIPTGVTIKELKLTIEKLLETRNLVSNKEILASPIFEILKNFPENFSKPVTLTFVFDPKSVKSNQGVAVFYYDEVKKAWVKVDGGKVNGNLIAVEVNHFTKYAVLVIDQKTGLPVTDELATDEPTIPTSEIKFSDIAGHWAEASINRAVNGGIVKGYTDGTFKPNATVTRAEFSVMLMNALKPQEAGAELTFTDSAKIGAWAQKAVAQAVQAGIISGYTDGTFRPNTFVTRNEMAVMIANALKLSIEGNATTSFADDQAIPVWAKGSVEALKKLGVVKGTSTNQFNPNTQATRAEVVIILLNMLDQSK
jgi:hypothetical protein